MHKPLRLQSPIKAPSPTSHDRRIALILRLVAMHFVVFGQFPTVLWESMTDSLWTVGRASWTERGHAQQVKPA